VGRYHIPGTYFLAPTNIAPSEALALMVLCHELGNAEGVPYQESARRAAVKLENTLPNRLREQLRAVAGSVRIKLGAGRPASGSDEIYQELINALADRQCVRIAYASVSDAEPVYTKLKPYHLFFCRHSWYVIGRSAFHRATRTFHLGRIVSIETLDESYEIPRGFSIERHLRNAWNLIPEQGPDQKVHIRFSKMVARNVGGVIWHKTQKTTFREDGALDFRVTVSGLMEISWWILGYGDQAEVIEPPELREIIANRAQQTAAIYDE